MHSGKGQQCSEARTNGAAKEMGDKAREVSKDQVRKGLGNHGKERRFNLRAP